ncbi:MAG: DnaA regulatory inactivator Hda [Gammaproteobacteria bacterium]|nr:DnaA regulatory inactivator Hda [Gammaproteobacteria bacterium]
MKYVQNPLPFHLEEALTFANFEVGRNGELISQLKDPTVSFLFLQGEGGCGKSHLLQAVCSAASARGEIARFLPLQQLFALGASVLEGIEGSAVVAIDDLQQIAGVAAWEEALFHLYNRMREGGGRVLVSGDALPAALGITTPDLLSRLQWGTIYTIAPLGDEARGRVMQRLAKVQGLQLSDAVVRYLLLRVPRTMPQLLELIQGLDYASMATKRRLTVPFVRDYLAQRESEASAP